MTCISPAHPGPHLLFDLVPAEPARPAENGADRARWLRLAELALDGGLLGYRGARIARALVAYHGPTGIHPSQGTLAEAAGCVVRHVRRLLHRLEALGLLRRFKRDPRVRAGYVTPDSHGYELVLPPALPRLRPRLPPRRKPLRSSVKQEQAEESSVPESVDSESARSSDPGARRSTAAPHASAEVASPSPMTLQAVIAAHQQRQAAEWQRKQAERAQLREQARRRWWGAGT